MSTPLTPGPSEGAAPTGSATSARELWLATGIAAACLACRLLEPEATFDEVCTFDLARRSLDPSVAGSFFRCLAGADPHPPTYYLMIKAWLCLGLEDLTARLLSAAAGVVTANRLFALVFERWGRTTAWFALLLLTTNPLYVAFCQQARMYPFAALFLLLALASYLRAVWRDEAVPTITWLWAALGISMHYLVGIPATVLFFLTLARSPRPRWTSFVPLLLCLPLVPLLYLQLGATIWAPDWKPFVGLKSPYHLMLNVAAGYRLHYNVPGTVLPGLPLERAVETVRDLATLLFSVLVVVGVLAEERPRRVGAFLGLTLAAIFTVGTFTRMWSARYVVIELPAMIVLIALGVTGGRSAGPLAARRWAVGAAAVGLSATIAVGLPLVDPPPPWARVAATVDQLAGTKVPVVVSLPDRVVMLAYHLGPRPNLYAAWPYLPLARLDAFLAAHDRCLLVLYVPEVMDPKSRLEKHLAAGWGEARRSRGGGPIRLIELARIPKAGPVSAPRR